jgi:hypothetical protein
MNMIVLLSLEPLAGELKYASVVWSAAGAWAEVWSPMSNNGGQHWGFTGAYLLHSFYVSTCLSLAQAIKSWSISSSTDQQDIWSCYLSTQSPSLRGFPPLSMGQKCPLPGGGSPLPSHMGGVQVLTTIL